MQQTPNKCRIVELYSMYNVCTAFSAKFHFILYDWNVLCFPWQSFYYNEIDRKHIEWKCSNVQRSGTREDNWFMENGK